MSCRLIDKAAVKSEAEHFGAWTTEGPSEVKIKASELLQKAGWEVVRPALATTVRCERPPVGLCYPS